jgi:hypothetical protein
MQQRRNARYVPKTAIAVQLLLDGYTAAYGELENISLGGARLTIGETFPVSQDVELRLAAEDEVALSFHTTAKVVWCQPATSADGRAHWGVRWTHFPRAARHTLEALITAACKQA